jgi:hypothetical protein
MSKKRTRFTVREIVAAIRKNGAEKIKDYYYQYSNDVRLNRSLTYVNRRGSVKTYPLQGGCAFGQAARNLGVEASILDESIGRLPEISLFDPVTHQSRKLNSVIRSLNDNTPMTLQEIADYVEKWLSEDQLNRVVYVD